MKYRPRWALLFLGAVIVAGLFSFPSWRKLLTFRGVGNSADYALASDAQRQVFADMRKTPGANPATAYAAMLTTVVAPIADAPTPDPTNMTAIKSGDFIEIDAVHKAAGKATLFRQVNNNALLLRFDDFSVTNGLNLSVYLSTATLPKTSAEMMAGQLQLWVAPLKGTAGNQNYTRLPPDLNLTRYRSVVIYSEDLKTVYSSATLQ